MDRRYCESLLIVAIGLLLHANNWHMLKVTHGDVGRIDVNNASMLLTASIILLLTMHRPHNAVVGMSRMMRIGLLIGESLLMLYATELLLMQAWQPLLKVLALGCHFASHLMLKAGIEDVWPGLLIWLRGDAYFFLRFFSSSLVFMYALELGGWLHIMMAILCRCSSHCCLLKCIKRVYSYAVQQNNDGLVFAVDLKNQTGIKNAKEAANCALCNCKCHNSAGPTGSKRRNSRSNSHQHIDSRQCRKNRTRTVKPLQQYKSTTPIEKVTQEESTC